MNSLLSPGAEQEVIIDWSKLDKARQPQAISRATGDSSSKTAPLGSGGETSALLGNTSSGDSENITDIDDWESLPWYRRPSVRGLIFCFLEFERTGLD